MSQRIATILEAKQALKHKGHLALHRASGTCVLGLAGHNPVNTTGAMSIMRVDLTPSEALALVASGQVDSIL